MLLRHKIEIFVASQWLAKEMNVAFLDVALRSFLHVRIECRSHSVNACGQSAMTS